MKLKKNMNFGKNYILKKAKQQKNFMDNILKRSLKGVLIMLE